MTDTVRLAQLRRTSLFSPFFDGKITNWANVRCAILNTLRTCSKRDDPLSGLNDLANAAAPIFLKQNEKKRSASSESEQNCQSSEDNQQFANKIKSGREQDCCSD